MISKYSFIYFLGIAFTIISTFIGYILSTKIKKFDDKLKNRSYFYFLCLMIIAYIIIFSIMKDLTVLSHHSYYDFAVFLDYFHHYSQNKGLFSSLEDFSHPGSGHWMGVHFTPLAYIFAFAYKILPSFRTINWLQTILMATSPLILYWLSRRFIGTLGAFCISLALLFNPTFQYITLYEFEYLRFLVPVGILALGVTIAEFPTRVVLLSSIAVLFIREDAPLMVFGMGVFVFFFQRDRRRLGVLLIAIALIYLFIILQIIMPLFREAANNTHVAISIFQEFGKTLPEILTNILLNPGEFLAYFFHPFKLFNLIMYFLPFSFLSFAGADVLIIILPTLAALFFSNVVIHSSYFLYYVVPILVVVVWSTIVGIPRLVRFSHEKERLTKWFRRYPPSVERVSFAVLIGSVACSIYFGPSPVSIQFWYKDFTLAPFRTATFYKERYQPSLHDETMRKVAAMIPQRASVSAEQLLLVDVYKSDAIRVFPWIEDVDYVFIDKSNQRKTGFFIPPGSWDGLRRNPQFYYDWVEKRPDVFELIYAEDGVCLFKRRQGAPPYPQPRGTPP